MITFKCKDPQCSSDDVFIKVQGTQTGLYCGACGGWQKWLNKKDKVLAERFIDSKKEGGK